MKKFLMPALCCLSLFMASCGDDEPDIPDGAIGLNMTCGDSATTIGQSDVYISDAHNFTSSRCGIVDLDRKGSLNLDPQISGIGYNVAVTPSSYYQIFIANDVYNVAGGYAVRAGVTYYNVYVDSWIRNADENITGAKIHYVEMVSATSLPKWGTAIDVTADSEYEFERGAVIDSKYEIYPIESHTTTGNLDIKIEDNRISFISKGYWTGKAEVLVKVRLGSVFTNVSFIVE